MRYSIKIENFSHPVVTVYVDCIASIEETERSLGGVGDGKSKAARIHLVNGTVHETDFPAHAIKDVVDEADRIQQHRTLKYDLGFENDAGRFVSLDDAFTKPCPGPDCKSMILPEGSCCGKPECVAAVDEVERSH